MIICAWRGNSSVVGGGAAEFDGWKGGWKEELQARIDARRLEAQRIDLELAEKVVFEYSLQPLLEARLTLQTEYTSVLAIFAIHFSPQLWPLVQVLITGAILARGPRTVTAILRVMGLSSETHFVNYHRVLQRAQWSSHALSHSLLRLLVTTFAPTVVGVLGGDETIERRRGANIKAKGVYRDPVRSSHSHFVKPRACAGSP